MRKRGRGASVTENADRHIRFALNNRGKQRPDMRRSHTGKVSIEKEKNRSGGARCPGVERRTLAPIDRVLVEMQPALGKQGVSAGDFSGIVPRAIIHNDYLCYLRERQQRIQHRQKPFPLVKCRYNRRNRYPQFLMLRGYRFFS
ncbi:MAG: hypothetical protein OHK0029_09060 [Armatimonadaceae bacterium]